MADSEKTVNSLNIAKAIRYATPPDGIVTALQLGGAHSPSVTNSTEPSLTPTWVQAPSLCTASHTHPRGTLTTLWHDFPLTFICLSHETVGQGSCLHLLSQLLAERQDHNK